MKGSFWGWPLANGAVKPPPPPRENAEHGVFARRAVAHVAAPRFAGAAATGEHDRFRSVYRRAQRWSLAGALPVSAPLLIAPGLLETAFGPDFANTGAFTRVLVAGAVVEAAVGPVTVALVMAGGERSVAVTTVVIAVASVVAAAIGAATLGAVGVAWATTLGTATLAVWQLLILRRLPMAAQSRAASAS